VGREFSARAVVLVYHAVGEVPSDPWSLFVSRRHLEEQMRLLSGDYVVLSLRQLGDAAAAGELPPRSVGVTFDDGYANNLAAAEQVLVPLGMPATFFLVSGAIGGGEEFWWDELARLLVDADDLPPNLTLGRGKEGRHWRVPSHRSRDRPSHGRLWLARQGTREALYFSVWSAVKGLAEDERNAALDSIRDWAGGGPGRRETHRILTAEEARRLAGLPGVEIGTHTARHACLPRLRDSEQEDEILSSLGDLECVAGCRPSSLAYPFGEYTASSVRVAARLGIARACTTAGKAVRPGSPLLELPRVAAVDEGGEWFAERLAQWFAG
jgi:peptidoglycan/xylan/chitin deacetylase (PgdA/CDA1 family)